MMKINVEFYVGTQKEADLVGRALAMVAAELPKEHLPLTSGSVGETAPSPAVEAEAPKAEKKKAKAEAAPAPKAETATEEATEPKKAKKAKAAEGPGLKEVNDAFAELLDKLDAEDGPSKAKEILKKYNAKKIPDLDKANYAAVIEDVKALTAGAAEAGEEEDDDDFGLDLGGEDDE